MDARTKLNSIALAKDLVLQEFDDGEITVSEMLRSLEKLQREELNIALQRKRYLNIFDVAWKIRLAAFAVFLLGFFISPFVYPKLFGYSSAEECELHATNRFAAGACYDLYPSIKK